MTTVKSHKVVSPVKAPPTSYAVKRYLHLCESLDSPVSLSCWLLATYGEWDQLVTKKLDPLVYSDVESFGPDYLAVSVLSKADFLPTSFDRRQTAKDAFWAAEDQCRVTNERLSLYASSKLLPRNLAVHGVLHRARELIHRILGDSPSEALASYKTGVGSRISAQCGMVYRFGPGATSLVKRYITAAEKYRRQVDVTPSLYPFWRDVCGPRWASHIESVSLNACNRVTFVPKNAKTFRAIAIEPHVNGYAQLGVSSLIRRRLDRYGIDLTVQADINRYLARFASLVGLATVDLKAASDTVSREIVWLLLPERWAALLDTVRSPFGELDGVEFEYQKFSSMGNGCTFELETLLFYALTRASGGSKCWTSVFGDDIICESAVVPLLREVLDFCGFTVNEEKSFTSGPFRESCGQDYFNGVNVRPFFWKDLDVPLWFKVPNDLRALAQRPWLDPKRKTRLQKAWFGALEHLPRHLDCRVPPGYESFGVVDRPPPQSAVRRLKDGWDGFSFTGWVFGPKTISIQTNIQAMLHCLDGGSYDGKGETSVRGMGLWKKARLESLGSWPDDGAWSI